MLKFVDRFNASGWGVECPTCHTVYFLETNRNCDRMYHQVGEDGKEHWKLLCICSERVSFCKNDITRFGTNRAALERGYASKPQWVRSSKPHSERVRNILKRFPDGFDERSMVDFYANRELLLGPNAREKGRH